jgi:hypothetical protein
MEFVFYVALPCLLVGMILLVRMRTRHKEMAKLRQSPAPDPEPISLSEWRRRAETSLRSSRERRGEEV